MMQIGEVKLQETIQKLSQNKAFLKVFEHTLKCALKVQEQSTQATQSLFKALSVPTKKDLKRLEDKLNEVEHILSEVQESIHKRNNE